MLIHNKHLWKLKSYQVLVKRLCSTSDSGLASVKFLHPKDLIKIEDKWKKVLSQNISEKILSEKQLKREGNGQNKYFLAMFPYPSGKLHMGHVRVYTIADAFARFYNMIGYKVFNPMGWDAFGLPAENAAINSGKNPREWTEQNIKDMKEQLLSLGSSFDWNHEIATCDPEYIKANQQIFVKLFNRNMLYQDKAIVNWDPVDKTVLANEQVDENGLSWRSGVKVEKKYLKQWFIKTTKYAKALYDDTKEHTVLGWEEVSKIQRHWIGKISGYRVWLKMNDKLPPIYVWIKHPSHLQNVAFLSIKSNSDYNSYIKKSKENYHLLNISALDPLTGRLIPIIICDDVPYVANMNTYLAFGKNPQHSEIGNVFDINIPDYKEHSEEEEIQILNEYKNHCEIYPASPVLHDWLISRQRYWGTPIPIVHCDNCGAVPETNLPVLLPEPSDCNVLPVLTEQKDWISTQCPKCGKAAKRETDTMDTFVDSTFYYLRYLDHKNPDIICDPKIANDWLPIHVYFGGIEHAKMHLYFSRFMHKFLAEEYNLKEVEPFKRLMTIGVVTGESYRILSSGKYVRKDQVDFTVDPPVLKGTKEEIVVKYKKMSKSHYNGVDPQEIIDKYGIDAIRLAVLKEISPWHPFRWSEKSIEKAFKWLFKLSRMVSEYIKVQKEGFDYTQQLEPHYVDELANLIVQSRKRWIYHAHKHLTTTMYIQEAVIGTIHIQKELMRQPYQMISHKEYAITLRIILRMLYPFCPHLASEYWEILNEISADKESLLSQSWPEVDENFQYLEKVDKRRFKGPNFIPKVKLPK